MKFHILTLFPEMVLQGLHTSIIGRAAEKGLIGIDAVNIRDYTQERHGRVDDYPYGGGAGMLIQAQPVYDAYQAVAAGGKPRTVYMTPQGTPFTQKMAEELAKEEELVILCGHYEGIDERVLEEIVTDRVSIGDYVLTGGELPAMVLVDAVSRLVPGVLSNESSAETESFYNDLLEYPQYSRPEIWHEKKVPSVLLSGNHRDIAKWRLARSEERTAAVRPDLYAKYRQKQWTIARLSNRKREHIHMMELLRRGNGELLYGKGENVIAYERTGEICLMTAVSPQDGEKMVRFLGELNPRISWFVVCQEFLAKQLGEMFPLRACEPCIQACYTRREPLPVRHGDIRPLGEEALEYLCAHYCQEDSGATQEISLEDSREYLSERVRSGWMFGAYVEGKLAGFIGLHDEGSMGMLYVEETFRGRGLGAALESYLINRLRERDWTPFCQIYQDNSVSLALQEKLGLYLSGPVIRWLEVRDCHLEVCRFQADR